MEKKMAKSDNIWDYITDDGKILDRKTALELLDNLDPWDLQEIAGLSSECRRLVRDWMELNYKKLIKQKPDSFFASMEKKNYYKSKSAGVDPFDVYYRMYNSKKTKEGINFLKLLSSMLRIFA